MTFALPKQSCGMPANSLLKMHLGRGYGTSSPSLSRWWAKMLP
jgi:hypothetical protein